MCTQTSQKTTSGFTSELYSTRQNTTLPTFCGLNGQAIHHLRDRILVQGSSESHGVDFSPLRDELLRLAIYRKKLKREASGHSFECYVLPSERLEEFISNMFSSKFNRDKRIHLIVRIDTHYLAVDCRRASEKWRAILFEASKDMRYQMITRRLKVFPFEAVDSVVTAQGSRMQKDYIHCGVFAYCAMEESSKTPDIFEIVEKEATSPSNVISPRKEVLWSKLPAAFLKNMQSLSTFDRFPDLKSLPLKDTTLHQYVLKNTKMTNGELVNESIQKMLQKLLKNALTLLDQITEDEAISIVTADPIIQFNNERSRNPLL